MHGDLYAVLLGVIASDRKTNSHKALAEEIVKHRQDAASIGAERVTELMGEIWDHGRHGFENKMNSFLTSSSESA